MKKWVLSIGIMVVLVVTSSFSLLLREANYHAVGYQEKKGEDYEKLEQEEESKWRLQELKEAAMHRQIAFHEDEKEILGQLKNGIGPDMQIYYLKFREHIDTQQKINNRIFSLVQKRRLPEAWRLHKDIELNIMKWEKVLGPQHQMEADQRELRKKAEKSSSPKSRQIVSKMNSLRQTYIKLAEKQFDAWRKQERVKEKLDSLEREFWVSLD